MPNETQVCPGNDSWWRYTGYVVVEPIDRPGNFRIYGYTPSILQAMIARNRIRDLGLPVVIVEAGVDKETGQNWARFLTWL